MSGDFTGRRLSWEAQQAGLRRKLERMTEQRDSTRRRLAAAEALIERIDGQAICVGMDGDAGNWKMLANITAWIAEYHNRSALAK